MTTSSPHSLTDNMNSSSSSVTISAVGITDRLLSS